MKVAIIGSGAAAIGILAGLESFAPSCIDITVFDLGVPVIPVPPLSGGSGFQRSDISNIYRQLREQYGSPFPPPKSHFGQPLSKFTVEGKAVLWKSEHHGGLTNFWGGGMFPFTDREFDGWPISAAEMDPYYRLIAEKVGVCGEADDLNIYFRNDYVNRPPLRTSPMIHELSNTINRHPPVNTSDHYRILAGSSRLALETRNENRKACVYCGECMLGCPSEAIWSAGREFHRYQASRFISSYIVCRVRYVKDRRVYYQVRGEESAGDINAGPFDLIYIAAGCIGSTEIVMRSLGISQGPQMLDTALLTFPIFYAGREGGLGGGGDRYFSLCNLSMIGIPSDPAEAVAQVSVYPAFDHLWRYYTPDWLWGLMQNVWRIGRWRLMLGRVYLTDAANRTFNFELKDDRLVIHRGPSPDISSSYRSFMNSLRQATNHSGFYIPPIPPIGHGTSSHYAGTLPYGDNLVSVPRHGRIAPGVHIADATTFPGLPAISPTFTIMANACRTAHESLLD